MSRGQDVISSGHLQVIGQRGARRWRAFWWDADGKHSQVLGPAWVRSSGRKTARGAVIWHTADGPKPDDSHLTPKEAQAKLRRLLEQAASRPSRATNELAKTVSFSDAAEAWLEHGERRRNLKRSTVKDYRQVLDAYLLPGETSTATADRRVPFSSAPVRDLSSAQISSWYDELPYGRTAEKLLTILRAIFGYARSQGWIEHDPTANIKARPVS